MGTRRPDLIVGVDFGMTFTGVSYVNLSRQSETVKYIQKWPGRGNSFQNKVPTTIVYPTSGGEPLSWGFQSESPAEWRASANERKYCDWFKVLLDPKEYVKRRAASPGDTPSAADVELWTEDYLKRLYAHVESKLSSELSNTTWHVARIEFIFSVPTTWEVPVVEKFKRIVRAAGFGQRTSHSVSVGMTEAEAAAVWTSVEAPGIFRERDVLMICDAGGGTTDISVLEVSGISSGILSLKQLDVVFGDAVGSAAIDQEFELLARSRLRRVETVLRASQTSAEEVAWEMMKSIEFQNEKCEHGASDDTPVFQIPVPQFNSNYVNNDINIRNQKMMFRRTDMNQLFEKEIARIFELIDTQFARLHEQSPNAEIQHLVLSGGLGSSEYVQRRLLSRYGMLNVHTAPEPQLAVCKGLVADRLQKLNTGQQILRWRCCRESYGTICRSVYDPRNPDHRDRTPYRDDLTGKTYVDESVKWFIKKGEAVSSDMPVTHDFSYSSVPGSKDRIYATEVVNSSLEKHILPPSRTPDVHPICRFQSDLSHIHEGLFTKRKQQKKHWWNRSKRYLEINYKIKVIIGPADINFELWFNDKKMNEEDRPIPIQWAQASAPPAPPSPKSPRSRRAQMPTSHNP